MCCIATFWFCDIQSTKQLKSACAIAIQHKHEFEKEKKSRFIGVLGQKKKDHQFPIWWFQEAKNASLL